MQLHNFVGCVPERTCNLGEEDNDDLLCVNWPESVLGMEHILPCPCGSFNDTSVYNRIVTRKCISNFEGSVVWDEPNFDDCIHTSRLLQLCRLLSDVS